MDTYDSNAWVSASTPPYAVSFLGMPITSWGYVIEVCGWV